MTRTMQSPCLILITKNMSLTAPLRESRLATTSPGPEFRGPHGCAVGGAKPGAEHL
jgi:hypothetical protein